MHALLNPIARTLAWSKAPVDYAPLALTLLAVLTLVILYYKFSRSPPPKPRE